MLSNRISFGALIFFLLSLLALSAIVAISSGAYSISFQRFFELIFTFFSGAHETDQIKRDSAVLWTIRIPRVLIAILSGAVLGASGTSLQGLFRTPIIEPGLIGISSISALSAAIFSPTTIGLSLILGEVGSYILIIAVTTSCTVIFSIFLIVISNNKGNPSTLKMLLAGISVNAFTTAAIAIIIFADPHSQPIQIIYWLLGSLSNSSWKHTMIILPVSLFSIGFLFFNGNNIDAAILGDTTASSLGINTKKLRSRIIISASIGVATVTSTGGVIGFVGLLSPLLLRPILGAKHQKLIFSSALLGSILVLIADTISRTIFAPTELPVGVLLTCVGGPAFFFVLIKEQKAGRL